jgi:hypothetical protein
MNTGIWGKAKQAAAIAAGTSFLSIGALMANGLAAAPAFAVSPQYDTAWQQQFQAVHGYVPTEQDTMDRQWSLDFFATYGRAPTDAEWQEHYFGEAPPVQGEITPSQDTTWQAQFEAAHGYAPTDQDIADRQWSLDFDATNGTPPTDQDWINHYYQDVSGESGAS